MVKCPFCHYDNEEGALFCEQCKSDLAGVEPAMAAQPVAAEVPVATAEIIETVPLVSVPEGVPIIEAAVVESAVAEGVPVVESVPVEAVRVAKAMEQKGQLMGARAAKKTMLARQVLQEINAGGRVSKKTQLAVDDAARMAEEMPTV